MLRDWFNESFSRHNDDNRVLQQLTTSMQISESPGELVSHLECYKTDNILCIIDRNCLNPEVNYFTDSETNKRPKELIMIYDSDHPDNYKIDTFHISDDSTDDADLAEHIFCPNYKDRVIELLDSGYPLIFNSLDYMNIPMGYVCYNYADCDNTRYTRTASTTGTLCMGIGSYINMSYQKNLVKQVNDYYEHDLLTGLYNRNGFNRFFDQIQEEKKNSGIPVTIIMYDLDGLKAINDNFGHEEGDRAIAALADSVKKSCPEDAFNVRFGGDEIFSVIIGECDKDSIVKKIDASLDDYNETSGKDYRVLASYGIYNTVFAEDFNINEALVIADKRMYEIKKEHHERYSMDVEKMIKKK
jgi:diguanylate cyclase (GGDEF)-like protein